MQEFANYAIPGIMVGFIYALIALGFVLIYRSTGVFNLAQGALVVIGSYFCFAFATQMGLPMPAAIVISLVLAAILGMLIERAILRPLLGQPIFAIMMVTLVIGTLLQAIMQLIWGPAPKPVEIIPRGDVSVFGTSITYIHISFGITSLILLGTLMWFFRSSKMGVAMAAVADDQQAAQSLGVRATSITSLSWAIACVVAAIGGILLAGILGASPNNIPMGLRCLTVAFAGGLNSIGGVILAGPMIGLIENLSMGYLDPLPWINGGMVDVTAFIVLMIILVIRPTGFFGWKTIERI